MVNDADMGVFGLLELLGDILRVNLHTSREETKKGETQSSRESGANP